MKIFFDDLELPRLARNVVGEVRRVQAAARRLHHAGLAHQSVGGPHHAQRDRPPYRADRDGAPRADRARGDGQRSAGALARGSRADARRRRRARGRPARGTAGRGRAAAQADRPRAVPRRDRPALPPPRTGAPADQPGGDVLPDGRLRIDGRASSKDLAKRFFTLLYLFLSRKYERVEVVFIRHTDDAEEVDEERFFHDRKTGGTVVLSALDLMSDDRRRPLPGQRLECLRRAGVRRRCLRRRPRAQPRLARARDCCRWRDTSPTSRWPTPARRTGPVTRRCPPRTSASNAEHFAMTGVSERRDIYPVFRELFARETA